MPIIDKIEELPYFCEDCGNFIGGLRCKAFDIIPDDIYSNPESHTKAVSGQKGDYFFTATGPRQRRRVYYNSDED